MAVFSEKILQARALLPLPAVLVVADAIVALKMHGIITHACLPVPGVMFGARKGTQVLDIAHAAQLHLQKGGDGHGKAGLAQGDIATYYDKLNCLRIARWIEKACGSRFWANALLRIQMLPQVMLTAGGGVFFRSRGKGMWFTYWFQECR